jgi:5-formyltetrahydrofolate cyclo-ligase
MGWGRGYYDRALRRLPGVPTIGVCFSCQVFEEVPHEPHDQPMGKVLHTHALLL